MIRNRSGAQFLVRQVPTRSGKDSSSQTVTTPMEADPREHSPDARLPAACVVVNYLLASLAGRHLVLPVLLLLDGPDLMGKYDFSSWTLHMASIMIFATLWGIVVERVARYQQAHKAAGNLRAVSIGRLDGGGRVWKLSRGPVNRN